MAPYVLDLLAWCGVLVFPVGGIRKYIGPERDRGDKAAACTYGHVRGALSITSSGHDAGLAIHKPIIPHP